MRVGSAGAQRSVRRPGTNNERRSQGTRPSAGCRGCDSRRACAGSGARRSVPTQSADAARRGRRAQGDGGSRAGPHTPDGLREARAPGDALHRAHRRGVRRSDTNPQPRIRRYRRCRVNRGTGRSVSRVACRVSRWDDGAPEGGHVPARPIVVLSSSPRGPSKVPGRADVSAPRVGTMIDPSRTERANAAGSPARTEWRRRRAATPSGEPRGRRKTRTSGAAARAARRFVVHRTNALRRKCAATVQARSGSACGSDGGGVRPRRLARGRPGRIPRYLRCRARCRCRQIP